MKEGGGAGGEGKVSAADLLWLLPRPARLNRRHTKHGALELPLLVLSHICLLATLSMALTEGCIPLELTRDTSREFCLDTPPPRPPTAPALPRAAVTATAAGAAPPPCQLLGCNGDWAAAAEVTPGRGSRARPAPEGTAESRSSGGGLLWGRGGSLSASPSFSADRRIPGAGARRAPGASPERGGQAGQPWGRSGRRHCTLRQAPRDAPWGPRAEATLSGELREDLAGTADARLAFAASVRGPGSAGEAGRGARSPGPVWRPPRGASLGPRLC